VHDGEVEAYIAALVEDSDRQWLPELFDSEHPGALYRVQDRHGVSVIALPTSALGEKQRVKILQYRLAQYLLVNFADARMVYETQMEHEPLSALSKQDIHVIAGVATTGQILCYLTMKAVDGTQQGVVMSRQDRPLFPVEQVHGWGVFNCLRMLADVSAARVREFGRFVKNQRLPRLADVMMRAPVEIAVATHRLLVGALRMDVDAIVGDIEEGGAKRNMDFCHWPTVVIHGTVPYLAQTIYQGHLHRPFYPFALLVSDLSAASLRLDAIEAALNLPAREGSLALLKLKRDTHVPPSSLLPPGGLPPLTDVDLPQRCAPLPERRTLLDLGTYLRSTALFAGLSVGEAAVLGTLLQRQQAAPGDVIIRQGDPGHALYLVEAGRVEVRRQLPDGRAVVLAVLGPGDYVGEIALITGGERTADVVALDDVRLLRLSSDDYHRYLSHLVDVERHVCLTATRRAANVLRAVSEANMNDCAKSYMMRRRLARSPKRRPASLPSTTCCCAFVT
jgi:CRP-like cAMP-binding protein